MLTQSQRDEVNGLIRSALKEYFTTRKFPGLLPSDAPSSGVEPGTVEAGEVAVFKDADGHGLEGRSLVVSEDDVTLTLYSALAVALNSGNLAIVEPFPDGHVEIRVPAGARSLFIVDGTYHAILNASGLTLPTAGDGLSIKEGTDGMLGTATLSAGVAVVDHSLVTANTRILLSPISASANAGNLDTATRDPGTSFTITSDNALDDREIAYLLLEPAA
ncbi:MAG TPA: hypothetical protein VHE12_05805 [bacterium]|nr:hypothetical protein [bacterium]